MTMFGGFVKQETQPPAPFIRPATPWPARADPQSGGGTTELQRDHPDHPPTSKPE
jgi:hypothetical protein